MKWKLVDKHTDKEVEIGATVYGRQGSGKLEGFTPPRHAGSTGRVLVRWRNSPNQNEYFPSVFNMKIVEDYNTPTEN
jgi:hypothetical protein